MAQLYWSDNYWNSNYWDANYWGNPVVITPVYWHPNYWGANYWNANYWANDPASNQDINQVSTPSMTMTAQVPDIDISLFVTPNTPTMTLTGLQADAANDVTVTPTVPTMTMTGINTSADTGEYYVADVNVAVFMSSNISWTETVNASAPTTMTMTANPANIEEGGAQTIGVTSTPEMTMSALNTAVANTVVVTPLTPQMTMTPQNVTTGFGTLVNTQLGSMTMTPLQANVTGVNADINSIDVTVASMMMSELNPEVVADKLFARKGRVRLTAEDERRVKRPRYIIEIDGETFEVRNQAEAKELLKTVQDLAEEQVDTPVPIKPVKIKVKTAAGKESRASGILSAVRTTKQEVKKSIEKQRSKIDFDAIMRRKQEEDDEASIRALLEVDNQAIQGVKEALAEILRSLRS